MNDKKKIIMGFRLKCGQAILENGDQLTVMDDPAALAQHYSDQGADHLYIRDLSETDAEHEEAIGIIKEIARISDSSVIAGGNVKRLEDVKNTSTPAQGPSSWTGSRRRTSTLSRRRQTASEVKRYMSAWRARRPWGGWRSSPSWERPFSSWTGRRALRRRSQRCSQGRSFPAI